MGEKKKKKKGFLPFIREELKSVGVEGGGKDQVLFIYFIL